MILLIGDGMGDSEITIARNYAYGAAGKLPGIDALPLTGEYTTYSVNKATGLPDYVPDSVRHRLRVVHRHQDLRQRRLGRPLRLAAARPCSSSPSRRGSRPAT